MDELDRSIAMAARLLGHAMIFQSPLDFAESVTMRTSDGGTVEVMPDRPLFIRNFSWNPASQTEMFLVSEIAGYIRSVAALSQCPVLNRPTTSSLTGLATNVITIDGTRAFGEDTAWWTGLCRYEVHASRLADSLSVGCIEDLSSGITSYRETSDEATLNGPFRAREGSADDQLSRVTVVGRRTWANAELLTRQFGLRHLTLTAAAALALDYATITWRTHLGRPPWVAVESINAFPYAAQIEPFTAEIAYALITLLTS